jgi:hypothetical protein
MGGLINLHDKFVLRQDVPERTIDIAFGSNVAVTPILIWMKNLCLFGVQFTCGDFLISGWITDVFGNRAR